MDLSTLESGKSLHLNDINLPKGVKALVHGKPNPVLVSVTVPVEEEIAAPAAAPAEAPAKGKGKK